MSHEAKRLKKKAPRAQLKPRRDARSALPPSAAAAASTRGAASGIAISESAFRTPNRMRSGVGNSSTSGSIDSSDPSPYDDSYGYGTATGSNALIIPSTASSSSSSSASASAVVSNQKRKMQARREREQQNAARSILDEPKPLTTAQLAAETAAALTIAAAATATATGKRPKSTSGATLQSAVPGSVIPAPAPVGRAADATAALARTVDPEVRKLLKAQARKEAKLQDDKRAKKDRAAAYEVLEKTKLSAESQELMFSTSSIGKELTVRQRLARVVKERRAGVHITDDDKLFTKLADADAASGADSTAASSEPAPAIASATTATPASGGGGGGKNKRKASADATNDSTADDSSADAAGAAAATADDSEGEDDDGDGEAAEDDSDGDGEGEGDDDGSDDDDGDDDDDDSGEGESDTKKSGDAESEYRIDFKVLPVRDSGSKRRKAAPIELEVPKLAPELAALLGSVDADKQAKRDRKQRQTERERKLRKNLYPNADSAMNDESDAEASPDAGDGANVKSDSTDDKDATDSATMAVDDDSAEGDASEAAPALSASSERTTKSAVAKPQKAAATAPKVSSAPVFKLPPFVRHPKLQRARMELPICAQEQEIVECINANDVVIICGETGSGKTTQVPQFLYEAGYSWAGSGRDGLIGVTEPRRVATVSTAKRVAYELNVYEGKEEGGVEDRTGSEEGEEATNEWLAQKQRREQRKAAAAGETAPHASATLSNGHAPQRAGGDSDDEFDDIGANAQRKKSEKAKAPKAPAATADGMAAAKNDRSRFGEVSYQIRYDSRVTEHTRIKFMTDGVLLKEISTDFLLRKYSVIVLDEAHERNINTDVLIGLLSRVVPLRKKLWIEQQNRKLNPASASADASADASASSVAAASGGELIGPLKLIIMSATLRVADFVENKNLFPVAPPVLEVPARQYEVTTHFNRTTPLNDYMNKIVDKVMKGHTKLPPGGMLVFLTGRQEIEYLCRKIKLIVDRGRARKLAAENKQKRIGRTGDPSPAAPVAATASATTGDSKSANGESAETEAALKLDSDEEEEDEIQTEKSAEAEPALNPEDSTDKTKASGDGDGDGDGGDGDDGDDDDDESKWARMSESCAMKVRLLPLYSLLPTHQQMKVFEPAKDGERVIVVSTNVAETSLTIPGIRYVIDSGREKRKVYDRVTSTYKFEVGWISQASASQRAGRAGRTGPGHCYRLYSSAVFQNQFSQYSTPEILCTPVDSVLLNMKNMNIENVSTFPFPTPPDAQAVRDAVRTLTILGAITTPDAAADGKGANADSSSTAAAAVSAATAVGRERITPLGRTLSRFPIAPRFAKMLVLAQQSGVLNFMVAVVASLSVGELFIPPPRAATKPGGSGDGDSDDDSDAGGDDSTTKSKRAAAVAAASDDDGDGDGGEEDAESRAARQRERAAREERERKEKLIADRAKEERRALQKAILTSKLKWTHRDSDLLTYLNLVGGYEYAEHVWRSKRKQLRAAAAAAAPKQRSVVGANTNSKRKNSSHRASVVDSGDRKAAEEEDDEQRQKLESDAAANANDTPNGDLDAAAAEHSAAGGGGFAFCKDNFLRVKAMREVQALRRQLHHIINKLIATPPATATAGATAPAPAPAPAADDSASQNGGVPLLLAPPTKAQQLIIRQVICAGLIDRIARKLTKSEIAALIRQHNESESGAPTAPHTRGGQSVKPSKTAPRTDMHNNVLAGDLPIARLSQAYQTLFSTDSILIHPSSALSLLHPANGAGSALASSASGGGALSATKSVASGGSDPNAESLPEWVVYYDLVRSGAAGRVYMREVTGVEADWISRSRVPLLCSYSKTLSDPAPKYESTTDRVVGWCNASVGFGTKHWPLPILKIPFPLPLSRVQHFCRLFLDGAVCTGLLPFRVFYTSKPSALLTLSESQLAAMKQQLLTAAKVGTGAGSTPDSKKKKSLQHTFALASGGGLKLISVLHAFVERDIDSKRKLIQIWKTESREFLLREVMLWLQPVKHAQLKAMWPPLQ